MPRFEIYDMHTQWKLGEVTAATKGTARIAARNQWPNHQIGTIKERANGGYDKHQTPPDANLTEPDQYTYAANAIEPHPSGDCREGMNEPKRKTEAELNEWINKAMLACLAHWGRYWKSKLRECWGNGNYPSNLDSEALQYARNAFGPDWLTKYRLPKNSTEWKELKRN